MPELPDIVLYIESLERLLGSKKLEKAIVKSPFLLRSFEPTTDEIAGVGVVGFRRMGKRIIWEMENNIGLVFHLMIAGRFHWRKPGRMPTQKNDFAAFQFEHGTMMLTVAFHVCSRTTGRERSKSWRIRHKRIELNTCLPIQTILTSSSRKTEPPRKNLF